MNIEQILSAGIDIGTTTTQLIFSRLTIQNTAGFGRIPQTEITDKQILYRSPIYFTPLLDEYTMDGNAIRHIFIFRPEFGLLIYLPVLSSSLEKA